MLVSALLLVCPGVRAQTRSIGFDESRPFKRLNLKIGFSTQYVEDSNAQETRAGDDWEFAGQFGLCWAQDYWTAEFNFYTDITMELSAGLFVPVLALDTGWILGSAQLFARAELEEVKVQSGETDQQMRETIGVALVAEYLWPDGLWGVYLEARQTFLSPWSLSLVLGVDFSPLLVYLIRQ